MTSSSSSSLSSSSFSSSLTGSLLVSYVVWAFLAVSPPVRAMPTDARENSIRANMDSVETASFLSSVPPTAVRSSSDDFLYRGNSVLVEPTAKPYDCSLSHRAHTNDSNKFQVKHNSVWLDQVCQIGLIWNQTLCRCDYQKDSEEAVTGPECRDHRPHDQLDGKYQQRVNGVWMTRDCNLAVAGLIWNQTACRCVWNPTGDARPLDFERTTPCETMLNITFEKGLVDDAKSSFVQLTSGSVLALRHDRTQSDAKRNVAAYFQSAFMTVWYFAGNDLSGSLRVSFRFKAEDNPLTRDRYQILISNGCIDTERERGFTSPTLAIGYRAADRSFLLALQTANIQEAIVCTRNLDPFAWHQVSLIYEDGMLLFRVDNYPCIISADFSGEVQKSSCPLTIGADPLRQESKYVGYLDDLVVARHCNRFVEQIMVVEEGKEKERQRSIEANRISDGEKKDTDDNDDNDVDNNDDDSNLTGDNNPPPKSDQPIRYDDNSVGGDASRGYYSRKSARRNKSVSRSDKFVTSDVRSAEHDERSAERDNQSATREDKSAEGDVESAEHGERSAERHSKFSEREEKSAEEDGKSAEREAKSAEHDDEFAEHDDKYVERDDKSAEHFDGSMRPDDKFVQRNLSPGREDGTSVERGGDESAKLADKAAEAEDKPAAPQGDRAVSRDWRFTLLPRPYY